MPVDRFYKRLNAKYDAAQTTDENERHWANADHLGPNAAASPAIRRRLRARARYELENNSYAKGMILTLANDLIGTGPRLQLMTRDKEANHRIERIFNAGTREIHLAEKLRAMRLAKAGDGEAFALLTNNPRLSSPVKLDIQPVECDFFTRSESVYSVEDEAITYDQWGNPITYWKTDAHPGEFNSFVGTEAKPVDAREVIHVYRIDRPGQRRGVTELVTALHLFAMLRRFTLATLAAAETAADFAAVLYTDSPADQQAASLGEDEWFDAIPMEYRAMLTLPDGWKMNQFKAEHPQTTYAMFKEHIIMEIARCLNMPLNISIGSSKDHNFSSGRLDHLVYDKSLSVERHQWECRVMDRYFAAWMDEAAMIPGLLPDMGAFGDFDHQWHWDSRGPIDEVKAANANKINLTCGTDNRAAILSRSGRDIDTEDQMAAESFGVTVEQYREALFVTTFGGVGDADPSTAKETADEAE